MARNLPHFVLNGLGKATEFIAKGGGSAKRPRDVANRVEHAQALLRALDALPNMQNAGLPGVYLNVAGRAGEVMITSGLNASGLKLLSVQSGEDGTPSHATVFATEDGINNLRKKIVDFETKNTKASDKNPDGRPRNADLAQSIQAIVEARLGALWRSPKSRYPQGQDAVYWEVWLETASADQFIAAASERGISFNPDRLNFPEDVVVIANATPENLARAVRRFAGVRALAAPSTTADFFDELGAEDQAAWVAELQERTIHSDKADPNYITLLDRGVSRAHPLLLAALDTADRHASDPAWGVDDQCGHGTQLAGLALFGDLTAALQSTLPVRISHRLESAKIIPDAGANPHHLLGAMTRRGIDAAETAGPRRRTFTLANTTPDDTPHDGAPTSWSSEIDQLTAGVSGNNPTPRLMLVSAGNTDQNEFTNTGYLSVCDDPQHELESPSHAWNAICVGAHTEKAMLPASEVGTPIARSGDLSPSSRTASWSSHWPIKPDIVMEGGNWIASTPPPPMKHHALSLLTTSNQHPTRSFTTCGDTSGATALAAGAITDLWSDYPDLWPETIRALFVSSARWTPQMRSHLPPNHNKGDYTPLFQRYGYGVPAMERARRSASNALTLIVQDTIIPYKGGAKKSDNPVLNEMKIFTLPWPVQALRKLGNTQVTLRIALSTFIAPNPSEPARGSKFRYASHNLRFKLNRANENEAQFLARISRASEQPNDQVGTENDGWDFGSNRRDVGSLHIDQLTCAASDLLQRNIIAVHPVSGWWKTKGIAEPKARTARYALIVEIDAETTKTDIYTEVLASIANANMVQTVV
jgi:Subtilase family